MLGHRQRGQTPRAEHSTETRGGGEGSDPAYRGNAMAVRIEKSGSVWTVIHSRPEARNAMDPRSAEDLVAAFEQFDADEAAHVAVFWGEGGAFCAGWDLKTVSDLDQDDPVGALDFPRDGGKPPRGPLGPSRLEL